MPPWVVRLAMAISPYDDLFLPLPASLSSRYTNTRAVRRLRPHRKPLPGLPIVCRRIAHSITTIRRWCDSSLVSATSDLAAKMSLSSSKRIPTVVSFFLFFFRSKTHLLSLSAIRFVPATLANLTVAVTGEKRKCKYSSINEQSFCCYLQHRRLTTRYNINNTR